MKVVISGGWSYGNIGDEAIAASTIFLVNKYFPEAEKIYTSYNPEEFYKEHSVKAILSVHARIAKRQDGQLDAEKIMHNLQQYHLEDYAEKFDQDTLFVMSGGGYLHEKWNSQFVARLLEIEIAKRAGAKCVLIGQSIGPFFTQKSIEQLEQMLNKVDYLSIRDESSKNFLESLNLQIPVYESPDLALLISDFTKVVSVSQKTKIVNMMPASYTSFVGMQGEKCKNSFIEKLKKRFSPASIRYKAELHKLISKLVVHGYDVNIVLSTAWAWDEKFAKQLLANVASTKVQIIKSESYKELCQHLAEGNIIISTKMHPLIISTSYGVPAIGISYNYKVDDFMKLINSIDECIRIDQVRAEDIFQKAEKLLEKNDKVDCETLKAKVYESFAIVANL